jgi:TRAP-type mannitol/chloroaromatic compound transport system permease small subunit
MFVSLLRRLVSFIDALSMKVGHAVKYLIPALILVLFFEVVSRYVFNKPTIWVLETSMMIFGSIGALCWGYTLRIGGHVRVDVFYTMLSKWWKSFIDVVLTLLFLFPFQLILIKTGIKWSLFAMKTGEKMVESSWLPPTAPFRIVLTIGFILFFIQAISEFIKNSYYLVRKEDLIRAETQAITKEGML